MVTELNSENFENETSNGTVIIDFYANWCGPCMMIAPLFERLSNDYADIKFVKVNVDESPDVAAKFSIRSIPTFVVLKNGVEIEKKIGAVPQSEFVELLNNLK